MDNTNHAFIKAAIVFFLLKVSLFCSAQITLSNFQDTVVWQCNNELIYPLLEEVIDSFGVNTPCEPYVLYSLSTDPDAELSCTQDYVVEFELSDNCNESYVGTFILSIIDTVDIDFATAIDIYESNYACEDLVPDPTGGPIENTCYYYYSDGEDFEPISNCSTIYYRAYFVENACSEIVFDTVVEFTVSDFEPPQWLSSAILPGDTTIMVTDCARGFRVPTDFVQIPQYGVDFADGCAANIIVSPFLNSDEYLPVGVHPQFYLLVDECDNETIHEFTITVECQECDNGATVCRNSCDALENCYYENCATLSEGVKGCTGVWTGVVPEWPEVLCNGANEANNISWFAFTASFTDYDVYVTPTDCFFPVGEGGLLSGVYDYCEDDDGECIAGTIECGDGMETIQYKLSDLVIDQVYYIYVSGCDGSECQFNLQLIPDFSAPNVEAPFDNCSDSLGLLRINYYCDTDGNGEYNEGDEMVRVGKPTLTSEPLPAAAYFYADSEILQVPLQTIALTQINADVILIDLPEEIAFDSLNTIETIYVEVDKTVSDTLSYDLSITPGFTERCDRVVPFNIMIENDGTIDLQRRLVLEYENPLELTNHDPDPVETLDRSAKWDYVGEAGSSQIITAYIRMPSVQYRGDIFCLKVYFEGEKQEAIEYCFELRCSYDPNDKHGVPFRGGPNLVAFDESLNYTIRFENLGNDTAFDIRIEDELSEYLDWGSTEFMQSSHTATAFYVDHFGVLHAEFENINLPGLEQDSVKNKGYLQYRINSRSDIPLKTEIRNKALIYFDTNPPIETNTTSHIMVDTIPSRYLDMDEDGFQGYEDCDDNNPEINPLRPLKSPTMLLMRIAMVKLWSSMMIWTDSILMKIVMITTLK